MRRSIGSFCAITSDILSALEAGHASRVKGHHVQWKKGDYYEQLGMLKHADMQAMSTVLQTENCPQSPLQVSQDAAEVGVVLTDRSVSGLMIFLSSILTSTAVPNRAECLREEGIELQWHAREAHIFGQRSMAALIHCCSLVPDMETAINVLDLAGQHATDVMYRSLLVVCRNTRDYERAKQVWKHIANKEEGTYRVFLQCMAYASADEQEILSVVKTVPVIREDHVLIALSGMHSLECMKQLLTFVSGKVRRTPAVNAQVVRILLAHDMQNEVEVIAAKQKVITLDVHGELLARVPGLQWVEEALVEAGLREHVIAQQEDSNQMEVHDKTMAALFAVGSCVANTAMGAPMVAASVGAVAGGAVAGSSGDRKAVAGASVLGTAAVAGAALVGSTPAAAGAVGSVMAFTSAAALNFLAKPAKPTPPDTVIPALIVDGNTTYRGPLKDLVPIITATPFPITVTRTAPDEFAVKHVDEHPTYTKRYECTASDHAVVLELIGNNVPFGVSCSATVKVFQW
eukprot:TRINITY_DN6595_c0_g1_i1.p1 TRINITY_DN6595_c0_g1~~TRINITY_DN6595_c0_g1_i1.p1  ORF type:complete len:516 (+),score=113.55 TRINITY_DN6595_c0_g1_i1:1715-3262(+)